jgi:hypothetical protein
MSAHEPSPNGHPKYETRDASIPAIIKSGASVYVTLAVAFVAMYVMYLGLEKVPLEFERTPTAQQLDRALPPGPPLLVDEPGNLKQFRANEDLILNSYQKDPKSGAIRIPIREAMKAIAHGAGAKAAEKKGAENKAAERKKE